ncbi:MAG: SpoIIE family protein phosphatase [Bacteroidales bacterium]|nr:SpoIIE family protein phosphatase [Bacteroidales bacterium]
MNRSVFSGLLVVLVAAFILGATSFIQYHFSHKGLQNEAFLRATSELDGARSDIMDIVNQTEGAVYNNIWVARWALSHQDSLSRIPYLVVHNNPVVVGSTLALVPGYLKKNPLLAPYIVRDGDGFRELSLATEEYDYPSQEWFTQPLETEEGYWSEPYFDEGGGNLLMTTFSMPVKDKDGKIAAILTADISLDWLESLLGNMVIYPHALNTVYSRNGKEMVSTANELKADEKCQRYETTVERTGWKIVITLPERDLYAGVRKVEAIVRLFQILGLVMLAFILRFVARNQGKVVKLNEQKELIQKELRIGHGIQMAMVPKVFPPFPERTDLDFAAFLDPAKEVGGDLYDYYIRDGKLYFCIGDVSGKGVPAALVMAVTRTLFRAITSHQDSPAKIVTSMNNALAEANERDMFVTFFLGVLDLDTGLLHYCNAGHNPPMFFTNTIAPLPVLPNLPLGVLQGMEFQEQQVQLHYDDSLFLYTDGLTEAENAHAEQFGEERMEKLLHKRRSAFGHLQAMKQAVSEFVDGAPQSDDLTMLFFHYLAHVDYQQKFSLQLRNDVKEISKLEAYMESIASQAHLDPALTLSLNLAIEEAVTNVILYAYPKNMEGTVDIDTYLGKDSLVFVISDSGKPFDPTTAPKVDITKPAQDRPIGGLGIHLVRNIMDRVHYEYLEGKNVLSLHKNI